MLSLLLFARAGQTQAIPPPCRVQLLLGTFLTWALWWKDLLRPRPIYQPTVPSCQHRCLFHDYRRSRNEPTSSALQTINEGYVDSKGQRELLWNALKNWVDAAIGIDHIPLGSLPDVQRKQSRQHGRISSHTSFGTRSHEHNDRLAALI